GNQGKGEEGKDWQNYANFWVDLNGDGVKQDNEFTNMIIGYKGIIYDFGVLLENNGFNKIFDGQGFTLKNINIDTTRLTNKSDYIGIFGSAGNATFKNININYMGGGIQKNRGYIHSYAYIGGFVGYSETSTFENMALANIGNITGNIDGNRPYGISTGGFAGYAKGTFTNITLNNIGDIDIIADDGNSNIGGFAGVAEGTFNNISLSDIVKISSNTGYQGAESSVGGFAGRTKGTFTNISLTNIGNLESRGGNYGNPYGNSFAGGFVGESWSSNFNNISLNNIGNIKAYGDWGGHAGGFAGAVGYPYRASFSNIFIYFNPNITFNSWHNYIGKLFGRLFLEHNAFL
ncbi:hypothetical protein I9T54_04350, partial [Campylobacter peloridis]|nr:hypothetical protein [Campylobacter peloridis]